MPEIMRPDLHNHKAPLSLRHQCVSPFILLIYKARESRIETCDCVTAGIIATGMHCLQGSSTELTFLWGTAPTSMSTSLTCVLNRFESKSPWGSYPRGCSPKSVGAHHSLSLLCSVVIASLRSRTQYLTLTSSERWCHIVACRAAAMQRLRDGRIYEGRFWSTAR
jgi:hypothetical protein